MKKILITGANGMLGRYLCPLLQKNNQVFAYSHGELDITSPKLDDVFMQIQPEAVIHLAAFTNVDLCEQEQEKAFNINGYALDNIVKNCNLCNSHLFFISTGMIFCGNHSPYNENARTDLPDCQSVNVYGKSKLLGEVITQQAKNYSIIRTSWLFGGKQADKKFAGKILELGRRGELSIINDTWGCPTYTLDLANAIETLVSEMNLQRIYHVVNSGYCNRVMFAQKIFDYANIDCKITEISSDEFYQDKPHAQRPHKEILSSKVLTPMRPWQEALKEYILFELNN